MNINGYFIFDGLDTRTLPGVTVVRGQTREAPAREFDVRAIPGRNGDMLIDGRKYPNIEITYYVMMRENVEATFRQLSGFLMSRTGYCKLADSWSTDEFYLAYVSQPILPTVSRGEGEGAFEVVFNRKPQRFLVSGDTPAEIVQGAGIPNDNFAYLENPSYFPARPQITLKLAQTPGATLTVFEGGLFDRVVNTSSGFTQYVIQGTRRAVMLYPGFQASWTGYLAEDNEIVVDCESRNVLNKTTGKSLNGITYLTDGTGVPDLPSTVYYPDFPEIPSILSTDYTNYTLLFSGSAFSEITVLPRWWSI